MNFHTHNVNIQMDNVRQTIKDWISLDDEERKLRQQIKEIHKKKTENSGAILEYMKANEVDNFAIEGNGVGNIGSSTGYFNRIFAVATSALYADVAERFESDELLDPGTVVELGGSKEITRSRVELSENVFGVISTRPAFTMNGGAGEDDTHPAVAMTGRVPVNVTGIINKGDRLVSAGNGIARSAKPGEATAFNVIGRALVSKSTNELGTVEAIVSIQI